MRREEGAAATCAVRAESTHKKETGYRIKAITAACEAYNFYPEANPRRDIFGRNGNMPGRRTWPWSRCVPQEVISRRRKIISLARHEKTANLGELLLFAIARCALLSFSCGRTCDIRRHYIAVCYFGSALSIFVYLNDDTSVNRICHVRGKPFPHLSLSLFLGRRKIHQRKAIGGARAALPTSSRIDIFLRFASR